MNSRLLLTSAVLATLLLSPLRSPAQEPSAMSAPPAQVSSTVVVSGTVVDATTNVPVPRCHLTLRPEPTGPRRRGVAPESDVRSAETDSQGRFSFGLPPEGKWQLTAAAIGYRTEFLNEHEGFSSAVVLHPGLSAPHLLFHLEPDSSVSGYVRDEAGEPVRGAIVSLQAAPDPVSSPAGPARAERVVTDDRGQYEIAGLAPGSYRLSVQATPWYTIGNPGRALTGEPSQTRAVSAIFDVVYPLTWYPGVFDQDSAGDLKLHAGESQAADFNLLPVPAAHVRATVPVATSSSPATQPTIERVDGNPSLGVGLAASFSSGHMDFGDLPPGLYRVTTPQTDGQVAVSFLHVGAGASVTLGAGDSAGAADVTFHIAGDDRSSRAQITLTDQSTHIVFTSGGFGLRRRFVPTLNPSGDPGDAAHHIVAPPGQYLVTVSGDPDLYLTSMTLQQRPIAGRVVTLAAGSADLAIKVARGRASISGHTILAGQPVDGAMVMLVPTTFGQAGSIDLLRRDQSDTDGSFNLADIIPGDYILFAIDRGWSVNWHNPATLNHYLVHGTPLSLLPRALVTQDLPLQSP